MLELSPDLTESTNNRYLSGMDIPNYGKVVGGSAAALA